jgi:RimJ/RimL family protein N-acetyltransferase
MDSLIVRVLNESDYDDILVGWWKQWGWEAPLRDFLPNDGTGGVMVLDGDTPICAGFMYMTNSKVSWVDWIISDKNYTKRQERREAIRLLIDTLTNISRNTGNKFAYALIKNQALIKAYEDLGYIKAENYTSEMIKAL